MRRHVVIVGKATVVDLGLLALQWLYRAAFVCATRLIDDEQ
jgi:hypothetical protein